jgi:THO complex subunit 3
MSRFMARQKTASYPDTPPPRSSVPSSNLVRSLAWSPLGNFVATGGGNSTLRVWNPEKSSIRNSTELKGHQGSIDRVAWNPDNADELATCGSDGTVRFWDVRSKALVGDVKVGGPCINLAWTPSGEELMVGRKVSAQAGVSVSCQEILWYQDWLQHHIRIRYSHKPGRVHSLNR